MERFYKNLHTLLVFLILLLIRGDRVFHISLQYNMKSVTTLNYNVMNYSSISFNSVFLLLNFASSRTLTSGPDPPSDLQVLGQEENTVYLSWKLPRGGFDKFQVRKEWDENNAIL